ncbi:Cro/Cl family transcriptional regulator [Vibrio cholerae]|nr:MAG: Cro/Cl family transcriptional regulator [Vibrionaceae bacterium]GHZ69151.1 Cro/Cl family transcriptional regulator [Vibrio cholerae]
MEQLSIEKIIDELGGSNIAKACSVTPKAVSKWKAKNCLPRTVITGESDYAEKIEALSKSKFPTALLISLTKEQLNSTALDKTA